ncbi:MAG: hypothetical protein IJ049_03130 [Oscillospiraceae bacterium]|nr:hypothetical protein [Oscillospiraceae bacterium]MBR1846081.1 hypothetical protein [Oscillospiraceae bacterium]
MKKTLAMLSAVVLTLSLTACGGTQTDADQTTEPETSSSAAQAAPPEFSEGEQPRFSDGERPELPEGEQPQFSDGERPELPEGEQPRFSDGERPELTDGERPQFHGPKDRPEEGTQPSSDEAQTESDTDQAQA